MSQAALTKTPHSMRWLRWTALFILSIILLTLAAAIIFYFNARAITQAYATHALGRQVTLSNMRIALHPLAITLDDVQVANAAWGTKADMVKLGHVVVQPEITPLFTGKLLLDNLLVEHASLLLERDAQGMGNWKKPGALPTPKKSPLEEAAQSRSGFPTILNLQLRDCGIVLITSSGAKLRIDFNDAHLYTADEHQPVMLKADGAYNGVAVHLDVKTQSYAALRAVHTPFAADILGQGATATVSGNLQLMDPLNFDQFTGDLQLNVKNIGTATGFFGAAMQWDVPFAMQCGFARANDDWSFTDAAGNIAGNRYQDSTIHLHEGRHKKPDAIQAALHFEKIVVDSLIKPVDHPPAKPQSAKDNAITASINPSTLLDAQVSTQQLSYHGVIASHAKLHAVIAAGMEALDDVAMELFGGNLRASATLSAGKEAGHLIIKTELTHIQAQQIMRALHDNNNMLRGDAHASLTASAYGNSVLAWLRSTQGAFRLSITRGALSRRVVQLASTDIRAVLHKDATPIDMPCMVAAARMHHGIGTLSTFQIQTLEGNLLGAGTVNLPQRTVDLALKSDPNTTSKLALDIPVHVTGTFDNLHILPGGSQVITHAKNNDKGCF